MSYVRKFEDMSRGFINVFSGRATGFHRQAKLFKPNFRTNFPLDGQTRRGNCHLKSSFFRLFYSFEIRFHLIGRTWLLTTTLILIKQLFSCSMFFHTSSASEHVFFRSADLPSRHAFRQFSVEGRRQQVLAKFDGFVPMYLLIPAE